MNTGKAPRRGLLASRLFWKIFALIGAVQVVSILAVGTWISYEHHLRDAARERARSLGAYGGRSLQPWLRGPEARGTARPDARAGGAGSGAGYGTTGRSDSPAGAEALGGASPAPGASGPAGAGPSQAPAAGVPGVPAAAPFTAQPVPGGPPEPFAGGMISDGAPPGPPPGFDGRPPGPGGPSGPGGPGEFGGPGRFGGPGGPGPDTSWLRIPIEPILGGILTSLVSSALLAWFLSQPIRSLRAGFAEAAGGNLDVRVAGRMRGGNDELKDLGHEFDHMATRLQALVAAQRRLLHDVSHELRSPLARMRAAIGLASQQPEQLRAAVERIDRESERMDRLIGELLALSRLQAGFARPQEEDIDLRELLSVIVDDASFEARAIGRSVVLSADADAVVRGNVELLRRAIENVVRNAIKFSYEGGEIRVDCTLRAGRERAVVTVRDAGPGIPEADLQTVFEPFYRSAGGEGKEGHGLGLAIAKRVVENLGGQITAANIRGGGLRVEIELPLVAAA